MSWACSRRRIADGAVLDTTPVIAATLACRAEDRLCPPEWHRRLADTAWPATLHVVEGAGHTLPLEQPARLASILASWGKAA